jgi:hypothetical protein
MSKLFVRHARTEEKIQAEITLYLQRREWVVKSTFGTPYSYGWPDLYAAHKEYGPRWIEVKTPVGNLRETQVIFITDFALTGVGVWVLKADTPEEYAKLFKPPNWKDYL